MIDQTYVEIVRLLLESAPAIFETPHFAMKGGTAINLFIEDMPRLSVDIDVVYTDHQATRDQALKSISSGLDAVRKRLAIAGFESEVSATKDGDEIKLFIRRGRNQVKVEVNHVFRGTVLPLANRIVAALAQWLAPAFGGGLRLAVDTDRIEALAQDRAALWERVTRAPFLTLNEKRIATGYGAVEDGDRYG